MSNQPEGNPAGAARAPSGRTYVPLIGHELATAIDHELKLATPVGGYGIGLAVIACHQHGLEPDKDLLDSLRLQNSRQVAENFVNRWIHEHLPSKAG